MRPGWPLEHGRHDTMEPAVDRRGYEAKKLTAYTTIPPQWSPPPIGGSTRTPRRGRRTPGSCRNGARMSREYGAGRMSPATPPRCRNGARLQQAGAQRGVHLADAGGGLAAMEPASDRREHPTQIVLDEDIKEPQWSPPVTGGNTWLITTTAGNTPQWSPPLTGGEHPELPRQPRLFLRAAIEPAILRAGVPTGQRGILAIWFKPQWSPPLTGGEHPVRH